MQCKHQIIKFYILVHKHSRECWLQWINWEAYLFSKYLLCYSLSSSHVLMPCVNDTFLLSWFINNSNQANLWLLWSDATCRSVIWWVFSLCKVSLCFFKPKSSFFYNNVIQRKLIALNNKGTFFLNFACIKNLYVHLTTLHLSIWNLSVQLTYARAVLYAHSRVGVRDWTHTLNPYLEVVKLRSNYEAMWVWVLIALHWPYRFWQVHPFIVDCLDVRVVLKCNESRVSQAILKLSSWRKFSILSLKCSVEDTLA